MTKIHYEIRIKQEQTVWTTCDTMSEARKVARDCRRYWQTRIFKVTTTKKEVS